MNRTSLRSLAMILMFFGLVSCSQKSSTTTQPAVSMPAPAQPAAEAPGAEAPPPAQNAYDGSWDGNADTDRPLNFTVEGGKVTYFFANYGGSNGSCSYNGAFSLDGTFPIDGKTFTAKGKNTDASIEATATGTFSSNNEISGTIEWKGNSGMCGPFEIKTTWKGKRAAE